MNTQITEVHTQTAQHRMITGAATITRADVRQINYHGVMNWAVALTREVDLAIIPASQLRSAALMDMVAVQATNALGSALGSLEIKEAVGRVVLVACEKAASHRDPVIPVTMVPLGRQYNRAYCNYVRHLARFHNGDGWWPKARRLCDKTLGALAKVVGKFTRTELAYLTLKLQAPLAFPTGHKVTGLARIEPQDWRGW